MSNTSPASGADARKGATILIVEDDHGAVEIFDQILREQGYEVRVAPDAEAGLLEIRRAAPAAVLLDLHLPAVDGLELLRRVRTEMPDARVPIAMITGDYFLEEEIVDEVRSLGARVLFKPLWDDELLKLVQDLLAT